METNHPFVIAAQLKLRFATSGGHLNTEDLFDLSLKSLDNIGMDLKRQIAADNDNGSLLENPDRAGAAAQRLRELQLEVIKAVIDIKQTANKAQKEALEKSRRREFLLRLQDKKRIDALESLSAEDIAAEPAALDASEEQK